MYSNPTFWFRGCARVVQLVTANVPIKLLDACCMPNNFPNLTYDCFNAISIYNFLFTVDINKETEWMERKTRSIYKAKSRLIKMKAWQNHESITKSFGRRDRTSMEFDNQKLCCNHCEIWWNRDLWTVWISVAGNLSPHLVDSLIHVLKGWKAESQTTQWIHINYKF